MRKQPMQPPVALLPNLELKLRQSGAATTVVSPIWTRYVWHHVLTEMDVEELTISPRDNLFRPDDNRARYARQAFVDR
jgi:hypothetical protein